jgi:alpha-glucosidase
MMELIKTWGRGGLVTEHFLFLETPNRRRVAFSRKHDKFIPKETFFYVALLASGCPSKITVNGGAVPKENGIDASEMADSLANRTYNSYYYNVVLDTTFIKVFDVKNEIVVVAEF